MTDIASRIAALDWPRIGADLGARGSATTGVVLTATECTALAASYDASEGFRSRVVMARHGYGQGEYRYFGYPLAEPVAAMRPVLYRHLVPIANAWEVSLGRAGDFPAAHEAFLERCHAAGQTKPTPLLLRYGPGDYNCLHQDLYGAHVFPVQVAFLLNAPDDDFTGGEFVLTEQRPRMQSRAQVVGLRQGEGVIFAVNHRPVQGTRGIYRVAMRHGVSTVLSGQRHTLGVIFHDAA